MPIERPDISVVFAAHREGALLKNTLRSIQKAIELARKGGFSVEVVTCLDRSDAKTREVISRSRIVDRYEEVDFGDPSRTRNAAIALSRGRWICMMDADNLFSPNWLVDAVRMLEKRPDSKLIVHPEVEIIFGAENYLRRNVSQLDLEFSPTVLLHSNYWDLLCVAPRRVFEETPFYPRNPKLRIGFEDWHWNCETVGLDWVHLPVDRTVQFRRAKKQNSINSQNLTLHMTPPASRLWDRVARSEIPSLPFNQGQIDLVRRSRFQELTMKRAWLQREVASAARMERSLRKLRLPELSDQTPHRGTCVPLFSSLHRRIKRSSNLFLSDSSVLSSPGSETCQILFQSPRRLRKTHRRYLFDLSSLQWKLGYEVTIQVLMQSILSSKIKSIQVYDSAIGNILAERYRTLFRALGIEVRSQDRTDLAMSVCNVTGLPLFYGYGAQKLPIAYGEAYGRMSAIERADSRIIIRGRCTDPVSGRIPSALRVFRKNQAVPSIFELDWTTRTPGSFKLTIPSSATRELSELHVIASFGKEKLACLLGDLSKTEIKGCYKSSRKHSSMSDRPIVFGTYVAFRRGSKDLLKGWVSGLERGQGARILITDLSGKLIGRAHTGSPTRSQANFSIAWTKRIPKKVRVFALDEEDREYELTPSNEKSWEFAPSGLPRALEGEGMYGFVDRVSLVKAQGSSSEASLSGWIFNTRQRLSKLEVSLDGKNYFPCESSLRLDILEAASGQPQSKNCGFRARVKWDGSSVRPPFAYFRGVSSGSSKKILAKLAISPSIVRNEQNALSVSKRRLHQFLESGREIVLPAPQDPMISIVILLYNRAELTLGCLEGLLRQRGVRFEAVLVDNASSDNTSELLSRVKNARIVRNTQNLHFVQGANQGATFARGKYLLFLNNDCALLPGALLSAYQKISSDPKVGVVGAKLLYPDGRVQEAGFTLTRNGEARPVGIGMDPDSSEVSFTRRVQACSGAFLLTRTELFRELGGFDSKFKPAYFEDIDYCLKARRVGFSIIYDPGAQGVHQLRGSMKSEAEFNRIFSRNLSRFRRIWKESLPWNSHPALEYSVHSRSAESPGRKVALVLGYAGSHQLPDGMDEISQVVLGTQRGKPKSDSIERISVSKLDELESLLLRRANYYTHVYVDPRVPRSYVEVLKRNFEPEPILLDDSL